jgi:hypothetical protein
VSWTLDTTTLSGDLILGLLDAQRIGTGFFSLNLSVAIEGVTAFNKSFSAAQVAAAETFFDDNVINLGDVAQDSSLLVAVNYTLVANAVDSGFGMTYFLGTTNDEPDTTPPPAPTVPDLANFSDSGRSDTDNITSVTTPTFFGKAEAKATVTLFDGATGIGSATADSAGNWSITSTAVLVGGAHQITAKATDAAGNTGPASAALTVTIDPTPPATPAAPDLTDASDSGSSKTDNLTNVVSPTFTGQTEANAAVFLFVGGSAMIGTTIADAAGDWSITTTSPLAEGVNALTVVAVDVAGNASAASPGLNVTIDTKAPAAPNTLDVAKASDTGSSSTDDITKVNTPVITGKAEANSTVTLFSGVNAIGSGTTSAAGTWSITTLKLTDGVHAVTAKATDAAGNISDASGVLTVTIDTVAPNAPTALDLVTADDSGSSNTDNITKVTTPIIAGKAEAGSTVTLFDGGTAVGTGKANASGAWAIKASKLADGSHTLRARATDVAGNTGVQSAALVVVIDSTAPVTPPAPDLVAASDSGASDTDNVTNDSTPTFAGKVEANATVNLFAGATLLGSAKVNGTGDWSITTGVLADGITKVHVTVTDVAGNVSAAGPETTVTIDTVAPTVPVVTSITLAGVSGTGEAGSTVTLLDSGSPSGSTTVGGDGKWSFAGPLSAGTHVFSAKANDLAGNNSAESAARTVIVGTAGPDILTSAVPALLLGAAGNDIYLVQNATDVVEEAVGGGFDAVYAAVGYTLPALSEIEFLVGNAGATGLVLTGNEFGNTIFGGAGKDTIIGGGGADWLFGGAEADVFRFLALSDSTVDPAGQDVISDYNALQGDLIDLGAIDANTTVGGDQAFTFIGDAAFSGVAGQLRTQTGLSFSVVSGDVNGDGTADFSIRVITPVGLVAGNFQL